MEKLAGLYGSDGYSVGNSVNTLFRTLLIFRRMIFLRFRVILFKLTWADLYIYEVSDQIFSKAEGFVNAFPKVAAVINNVKSHAKVSEYIKGRKETPF